PDIGVDHGGIGDHGLRLAVGNDAPGIHAYEALDHANKDMHDVLDPDDRQSAAAQHLDRFDQAVGFLVSQAAADLVEQQYARLGRNRPRQFQSFAIEKTERFGSAVG